MSEEKTMDSKELLDLYGKVSQKASIDDKNLFEMANLKEYRHSAILGYLLKKEEYGSQIHLKTFLTRIIQRNLDFNVDFEVECERTVSCGGSKRPIDVLVKAKDKSFALIIENKCRGAGDQEAQISDYWKGVKNLNFDDSTIYVLYLPPMNSFSMPSDQSLGEDLKKRFEDEKDLKGHLIVQSYRDLVLPWLREDVLPNITYGTGNFINSLKCYIDLLEGAFGERAENCDDRQNICKRFAEFYGLDKKTTKDLWNKATEVINSIEKIETASESDANKLGELNRLMWHGVKSVLREKEPLLDPPNLSYEVYWLLRNNPTPFGSKILKEKLDPGSIFFKKGRKQSAWDGVNLPCGEKEIYLECVFNVDAFKKYLEGNCEDNHDEILTFGLSIEEESSKIIDKLEKEFSHTYLKETKWHIIRAKNKLFDKTKDLDGGNLIFTLAKIIAEQARRFSEVLSTAYNTPSTES